MAGWLDRAISLLQAGEPCILLTVVATDGSTPREAGSKMLVHEAGFEDSIGGGNLEFKAIARARAMLAGAVAVELAEFALGPSLGQCCGGRVVLMLERLDPRALSWLKGWQQSPAGHILVTNLSSGEKFEVGPDNGLAAEALGIDVPKFLEEQQTVRLLDHPHGGPCYVLEQMKTVACELYLFGAGHVGRALVHVLAGLPYRIHWFDARSEMFPGGLPQNVVAEVSGDPRHDVGSAPPGALFLVMTHSHALDFDICDRVLRRGDFTFLGLIGSTSKRASFARRLRLRGHSEAALARLTCPIGLATITGKAPAAVAISIAGQLLSLLQSSASGQETATCRGHRTA